VVGNVGEQEIAAFGKIRRPFGPAHAGGDLFDGRGIEPVFCKAGIEDLHRRIGIALVRRERKRLRAGGAGEKRGSSSGAGPCEQVASRHVHWLVLPWDAFVWYLLFFYRRHCEKRSDEAIHSFFVP